MLAFIKSYLPNVAVALPMRMMNAMTQKPARKKLYIPHELSLPPGSKVFGFALDEIQELTFDDLIVACIKRRSIPDGYEWMMLHRYGFEQDIPKKPADIPSIVNRLKSELKPR